MDMYKGKDDFNFRLMHVNKPKTVDQTMEETNEQCKINEFHQNVFIAFDFTIILKPIMEFLAMKSIIPMHFKFKSMLTIL